MNRKAALIVAAGFVLVAAAPVVPALAAAPAVSLSATSLQFGPIAWLQPSPLQTIVLTNTGDAALAVQTVDITGQPYIPEDFLVSSDRCSSPYTTIAPGAQCQISIEFKPQSGGPRSATVLIYDNAPGSPQQVALSGTGTGAVIMFTPRYLDFGTVVAGTTSAPLTFNTVNAGDGPVTISSTALGPTPWYSSWFAITADGCTGKTLGPGQRCAISVTVSPAAVGSAAQIVNINDNAGTGQQTYDANLIGLTASGGGPHLAINQPIQNSFNQGVGTTSAPSAFQVFDSGTQPLLISSVGLDNSAAGFTIVSDTCSGTTLAVPAPYSNPATCAVDVAFSPPVVGSFSGNLVFHDNEIGGSHSQFLGGTGFAPVALLSTNAIDFGLQADGTSSTSQVVTLSNPSPQTLTVTNAALTGQGSPYFHITSDTCSGTSVAPAGTCSVGVSFSPPFPLQLSATLSFTDGASGSPHTVSLAGEGLGTAFSISTSHLSFGNQHANVASSPQAVTVTNTSATAMSYGHLMNGTVTGCATAVQPGASCTLSVTVTPTTVGPQSVRLSIFDSANNVQFVQVDWNGTSGWASLEDGLVNGQLFQRVGSTATVTVVLRDSGSDVLTVGQVFLANASPAAITADNCSNSTLPVGGICTIEVTATPTVAGSWSTTLTVPNDAAVGPNPAIAPISGLATASTQPVFAPASVTFPSERVGAPETTQVVWLINGLAPSGGAQLTTISSVAIGGADASSFRIVSDGCTALAIMPAYSCPVLVGFDPTAGRTLDASLNFNDDGSGSPQAVPLSGTGLAPAASFSAQQLNFGVVAVGQQTQPQQVTLTNSGNYAMSVAAVATPAGSPFVLSGDTCGASTLQPGASCTVSAAFAPSSRGAYAVPLAFTDNAPGSPQQVTLNGQAVVRQVSVSPASIDLGRQPVGSSNPETQQLVTVTNTGLDPVDLAGFTLSSGFAMGSQTCSVSALAPGASCTVGVYATPATVGTESGHLTIADDAIGAPQNVSLSAVGLGSIGSVSPASLDFGNVVVNSKSTPSTLTFANTGNTPLTISRVTIGGTYKGDYTITSESCQNQTLAPGASCKVTIVFRPGGLGGRPASLTFTDFALNSPQVVPLAGSGTSK